MTMRMPTRLPLALVQVALVAASAMAFAAGPALAMPSQEPFEILPGSFTMVPSTTQAGAHENLTTTFDFAHNTRGQTDNDVNTVVVNLPAGFDANNTAVPTCTDAQLIGVTIHYSECPPDTQVGQITFTVTEPSGRLERATVPLNNIETTSFGITAELGFKFLITGVLLINPRPGDSGLTVTTPVEKAAEAHAVSVTVWGVPGAPEHDAERGRSCYEIVETGETTCNGGEQEFQEPVKPYLANPTSCGPHLATMEADSWEHPEEWSRASFEIPPIVECERLHFTPAIAVQPTTRSAESPSGLDVSLEVPQAWEDPETLATANLKQTTLTLPAGITINPSAGSGLGSCAPEQFVAESAEGLPGSGCPEESKIGSIEIETPVLAEKIPGAVYVAKPFDNPFDSLLGLYIVAKSPARGIIIKLAGKIEPNPVTGQLVTTFGPTPSFDGIPASEGTPQQPFNRFTLKFRPGATAPLVSPPACGSYTAEGQLVPWSDPLLPQLAESSFQIESGIGGSACPAGGVPPFHPGIVAGTLNNSAGAYSPMDIHITRNDGEQEITRFTSILPAGLTAKLTGIPFCPDADIEAAKHLTGAQEEAEPSCPAASEIGHTLVGAGVGSVLAYTPGKLYMAGPYNGAPFSVVSITSAKVGPFDLGTVVIRFALEINPETAVVTVDAKASDPIPHIIDGIIIHVRDIRVYVDRPEFMINPTNCDPENFAATVDGAGADPADPADQEPVTVTSSFQMANCQNLQFKPSFKVSSSGKTSKVDGASLTVHLAYPNAPQGTQTNIKLVKVELPERMPSRLTTLRQACPAATFEANPASCPADSAVGHASATTPILPVPLTGPAYFVSYGSAKFPELVMVLQGYGVTLELHGETFISKGITSSTFHTVPDDPIGSFELTLPQGPYSALAATGSLCKGALTMPTEFLAQNGDLIRQNTKIAVTGCPKRKTKAKKIVHKRRKGGKAPAHRGKRRGE
jgi:hypothetical protein